MQLIKYALLISLISTIGSEKALGICGSGIVDAITGMLDKGIIDETGRIIDKTEDMPEGFHRRKIILIVWFK